MPIKIVIADTSFSSRKGLKAVIQGIEGFKCIAEASDAKTLPMALHENSADILIVNYCCNVCFPLMIIKGIKVQHSSLKILVIAHEKSLSEIRKLIGVGITNCLFQDCSEKEILHAIEACIKGVTSFPKQIIDAMLTSDFTIKSVDNTTLSERENEIIKLIAQGLSGKEIAERLFLSYHTISTHRKNIFQKLNIKSSAELILYALRVGLISLDI